MLVAPHFLLVEQKIDTHVAGLGLEPRAVDVLDRRSDLLSYPAVCIRLHETSAVCVFCCTETCARLLPRTMQVFFEVYDDFLEFLLLLAYCSWIALMTCSSKQNDNHVAGLGLEPRTVDVLDRRSNLLSYPAVCI